MPGFDVKSQTRWSVKFSCDSNARQWNRVPANGKEHDSANQSTCNRWLRCCDWGRHQTSVLFMFINQVLSLGDWRCLSRSQSFLSGKFSEMINKAILNSFRFNCSQFLPIHHDFKKPAKLFFPCWGQSGLAKRTSSFLLRQTRLWRAREFLLLAKLASGCFAWLTSDFLTFHYR